MINNSSIGKWERLSQKQQDVQFINRLQAGLNCSPFEAKAILNCVYEVYQPFFDNSSSLKPGQICFEVVGIENSAKDRLSGCQMKTVVLTLDGGANDIEAIFKEHGFRAKADIYLYIRNNDWTYNAPQIFNLDFSTYEQSDDVIEINSRRSDLYEFLKEKESVNFDIPVSEIKESLPWNFERIKLKNEVNFLNSGEYDQILSNRFITLSITNLNSDVLVHGVLEYKTVTFIDFNAELEYFLTVKKNIELKTGLQFSGSVTYESSTIITGVKIFIAKHGSEEQYQFPVSWSSLGQDLYFSVYADDITFTANKDEKFSLQLMVLTGSEYKYLYDIKYEGTLNISYIDNNNLLSINIINPNRLLQKLADKITETEGYASNPVYPAVIEDFNDDDQNLTMLIASESIRGFGSDKVQTSYKDFKEWMTVFGYEPFVNDNQLIFRMRKKTFNKEIQAIELSEEDCTGLKISVEKDYLFSGLKIGYKKDEYENTNGRFEFNGQHDYATDYTGNSKPLELISPYRADCYGIEFLAQKRGKDTTDDKSDKDLFIVNVKKGNEFYETIITSITDNKIPQVITDTLFNAKYNPFELLKLNANLLGASANQLKFTASDANRDVAVNGERIDGDYIIPESSKLFDAINYDLASRNIQDLPANANRNGIVKFHYNGNTYEGFIKEISKNPAWETKTQWVLFKKHDI